MEPGSVDILTKKATLGAFSLSEHSPVVYGGVADCIKLAGRFNVLNFCGLSHLDCKPVETGWFFTIQLTPPFTAGLYQAF